MPGAQALGIGIGTVGVPPNAGIPAGTPGIGTGGGYTAVCGGRGTPGGGPIGRPGTPPWAAPPYGQQARNQQAATHERVFSGFTIASAAESEGGTSTRCQ